VKTSEKVRIKMNKITSYRFEYHAYIRYYHYIYFQKEPEERSRYSDYATDWTVRGSNPCKRKVFSFPRKVQTGSRVHSASVETGFIPGEKRPGREIDCSLPTSAKTKN